MHYSMAKLDGRAVAAIARQQQEERETGVPPHWNSYITVDEVDAVSGRVEELGGTLLAPPFDVMEVGRMAALSDPTGAVVFLWQARQHIGAGVVNIPGAFTWNELATRDPESAQRFWSELLGWEFARVSETPAYWSIRNGGRPNGGMRELGAELPPETPAHWLVYFAVDDIEATAQQATDAGAQLLLPKTGAAPGNWFAVLADPPGAPFGIAEGQLDD
jgi:predicted enzyme related to lactoylglutathione lyase